ncbi:MAG: UDP-N-acetylglucosamine 1-carboxyvinyltransferase [Candidatus Daviesbacteria bacterium]|nr:UDP-N-acetylglucosamine 1-carboxyvinyltransferase [Candidatus Daviesbacteria bacterium]
MKYKIIGGHKLEGKVNVSGSKNSVFPCVAAALLTSDEVILENVSNLKDTEVLIAILRKLGISVEKNKSTLVIKASDINKFSLPENLMTKLRGSIVLVGALLGRLNRVNFYHPGGDIIGKRSIETHLEAFKELGGSVKKDNSKYSLTLDQKKNSDIFLSEASVTATENLVLASVLGDGQIILRNCAKEPHIIDLCRMLTQMGAKIEGTGGDTLKITGVGRLNGTKYRISADYLEIGTYIIASAITGGQIRIEGLRDEDLDPVLVPLRNFGIRMERDAASIIVYPSKLRSISKLTTNIWPGFPTDLMSVAIVLATQSQGITLCHDWMYEGRMFFTDKLISMGAKITLADPHRVLVSGPGRLRGRNLESPDIRAGMALVVAALGAKGKSIINQAELIERGYEDVTLKLKSLGADIVREGV